MIQRVAQMGRLGIGFCEQLGRSGCFLLRLVFALPNGRWGVRAYIKAIYESGILSLPIIVVSGLFVGMVLALQGHQTLQRFGAAQHLGELLTLSVVRELGPVVSALLFAGRAGSALTAEIGLMRVTQQLASMEMMAVDPVCRVVAPRYWGGVIAMPILSMIFCVVAVYGGAFVGVHLLGLDAGAFWSNMQGAVNFGVDVFNGIIKSIVFGCVITWIAVYQGFYLAPTAEGISRATTKTVVYSSLAILGLDFILTAMMLGRW